MCHTDEEEVAFNSTSGPLPSRHHSTTIGEPWSVPDPDRVDPVTKKLLQMSGVPPIVALKVGAQVRTSGSGRG